MEASWKNTFQWQNISQSSSYIYHKTCIWDHLPHTTYWSTNIFKNWERVQVIACRFEMLLTISYHLEKEMWLQKETDRMCKTQFANKGVYLNSYKLKVLLPLSVYHDAFATKRFLRMTTPFWNFSLKSFHLANCPERFHYFNNVHF